MHIERFSKMFVPALLVVVVALASCGGGRSVKKGELSGNITISGAFALYPIAVMWAEGFMQEHPGVRIDISAGGAGKGMTDVLSGMVDLAMLSREVAKAENSQGAWSITVAKDAVLPMISTANPYFSEIQKIGITKTRFSLMYISGELKFWGELLGSKSVDKIDLYTRSDACGAAEMWASFLGKHQEDLQGVGVFGDPGMADAVKADKFSLGYNNLIFAYNLKTRKCYSGIAVVPIDLNEDGKIEPQEAFYSSLDSIAAAIKDGRYPSPPARNLYLISKGKPKNEIVVAFIKYILTKGQQQIPAAGYIPLKDDLVNEMLQKVE